MIFVQDGNELIHAYLLFQKYVLIVFNNFNALSNRGNRYSQTGKKLFIAKREVLKDVSMWTLNVA